MKKQPFRAAVDLLVTRYAALLRGRRFGLIAHPASVDAAGCPSAVRLRDAFGDSLAALFSPEHGFFGIAGAGEDVATVRHPSWGIPVFSLYGDTRRPTAAMLADLDTLVFDLQDLSIRCYTYVSTLRYVLEAAAAHGKRVVVCDRPNPLAGVVDGPVLDQRFESFVGCFPGPLVYGLTSGEAARALVKALRLKVELEVVPFAGVGLPAHGWVSPSPGIRTPHTAWCYPVTVGFEAWPAVDYGRGTLMPFELVGARDLDEQALAAAMMREKLPGIGWYPTVYEHKGEVRRGLRIVVHDPSVYRPVASAVALLIQLQTLLGKKRLWRTEGSRPAFFDQLYGTDTVRKAIMAGRSWRQIAAGWKTQ